MNSFSRSFKLLKMSLKRKLQDSDGNLPVYNLGYKRKVVSLTEEMEMSSIKSINSSYVPASTDTTFEGAIQLPHTTSEDQLLSVPAIYQCIRHSTPIPDESIAPASQEDSDYMPNWSDDSEGDNTDTEIGDEDSRVHAHIAGTSAPVFSGEPSASQGCGKNGSVIKVKKKGSRDTLQPLAEVSKSSSGRSHGGNYRGSDYCIDKLKKKLGVPDVIASYHRRDANATSDHLSGIQNLSAVLSHEEKLRMIDRLQKERAKRTAGYDRVSPVAQGYAYFTQEESPPRLWSPVGRSKSPPKGLSAAAGHRSWSPYEADRSPQRTRMDVSSAVRSSDPKSISANGASRSRSPDVQEMWERFHEIQNSSGSESDLSHQPIAVDLDKLSRPLSNPVKYVANDMQKGSVFDTARNCIGQSVLVQSSRRSLDDNRESLPVCESRTQVDQRTNRAHSSGSRESQQLSGEGHRREQGERSHRGLGNGCSGDDGRDQDDDRYNSRHHSNTPNADEETTEEEKEETLTEEDTTETTTTESLQQKSGSVTKGKYKKPARPCLYCGESTRYLSRHLLVKHSNEEKIRAVLDKGTKQDVFDVCESIKREALFEANKSNIVNNQVLCREKAGTERRKLGICGACRCTLLEKNMPRHKRKCKGLENLSVPASSSTLQLKTGDSEFLSHVVLSMRDDEVGSIVRSDFAIKLLGKTIWEKSVNKNAKTARTKMRLLAKLLMEARDVSGISSLTGEEMLQRSNFGHLRTSIDRYTNDSTRVELGYALKEAVNSLEATYLTIDGGDEKSQEYQRYGRVLGKFWAQMFRQNERNLVRKREVVLRRPHNMPEEEDIESLKRHMDSRLQILCNAFNFVGLKEYVELRSVVVTRLTLFNARRGGEAAKLTLQEYEDACGGVWEMNLPPNVSEADVEAMRKFKLAYQCNKGGSKLAPLLIPVELLTGIDLLIKSRESLGIVKLNPYVFANVKQSKTHVLGSDCVRSVCHEAGVNDLTSTKMRHRAATVYASEDIPQSMRKHFYDHMGHSAEINEHVYQAPPAITEMVHVGTFLERLDQVISQPGTEFTDRRAPSVTQRSFSMRTKASAVQGARVKDTQPGYSTRRNASEIGQSSRTSQDGAEVVSHSEIGQLSRTSRDGGQVDSHSEIGQLSRTSRDGGQVDSHSEIGQLSRTSRDGGQVDSIPSCTVTAEKSRPYRQWGEEATKLVQSHFNLFIKKEKGRLPGIDEIRDFQLLHPMIKFDNTVIKSKVANERKLFQTRYTDNELATSKLKQENLRLQQENKYLRSHQEEISELKKMNICLQNQLTNSENRYDRAIQVNNSLEERLQHRIEVQERSHKESQAKQIPVCDGMRYNSQEEQKLYEAMLDMEGKLDSGDVVSLQQYIVIVKQQMSEVASLKSLASTQQHVITELQKKLKDINPSRKASALSLFDRPITCVDDMEGRKLSPHFDMKNINSNNEETTKHNEHSATPPAPHHKIASQNSEPEELAGEYVEPLFMQQDTNVVNNFITNFQLAQVNDLQQPGNAHGLDNGLFTSGINRQMISVGGGGTEVSDGIFEGVDEPVTIQYNESEDFTIHSGEDTQQQTAVKHIKPSTLLHFRDKAEKNKYDQGGSDDSSALLLPSPHKPRLPSGSTSKVMVGYSNIPPGYAPPSQQGLNRQKLSPYGSDAEEEVFEMGKKYNLTDSEIRHGLPSEYLNNGLAENTRLSQSENLGRVKSNVQHGMINVRSTPNAVPLYRSSPQGPPIIQYAPTGDHNSRCGHHQQQQKKQGAYSQIYSKESSPNHSPRTSDSTNHLYTEVPFTVHHRQSPSKYIQGGAEAAKQRQSPSKFVGENPGNNSGAGKTSGRYGGVGGDTSNNSQLYAEVCHPKENSPVNVLNNSVTKDLHPNKMTIGGLYLNSPPVVASTYHNGPTVIDQPTQPQGPPPAAAPTVIQGSTDIPPPSPHTLESTYLKVRLPPVENTETGGSDNGGAAGSSINNRASAPMSLSDNTSDMRICPVCSYLFPVMNEEYQSKYERHVEQCLLENGGEEGGANQRRTGGRTTGLPPALLEYRKCPMCDKTFDVTTVNQETFERHVELHFNDEPNNPVDNFEVLNI